MRTVQLVDAALASNSSTGEGDTPTVAMLVPSASISTSRRMTINSFFLSSLYSDVSDAPALAGGRSSPIRRFRTPPGFFVH